MKHKFTIEDLKKMSDDEVVRILVNERANELTNPYAPLFQRLQKISDSLTKRIQSR